MKIFTALLACSTLSLNVAYGDALSPTAVNPMAVNPVASPLPSPNTQQSDYNQAGDDSKKGADISQILSAVWGGIAGICTAACVASKSGTGASMEQVCQAAGLAGTGANGAGEGKVPGAVATTGSSAGQGEKESCGSAAKDALESAAKAADAAKQKDAAQANSGMAAALQSDTPPVDVAKATPAAPTLANLSGGSPGGAAAAPAVSNAVASLSSGACAGNPRSSTTQMINCAVQNDPSLPSVVKTPAFQAAVEKLAGKPLNEFFPSSGSPAAAIAAMGAAGAGLSRDETATLAKKLLAQEEAMFAEMGQSSGGGGGGSRHRGSAEENPFDPSAMMATLMNQLNPGKDETKSDSMAKIELANQTRSPASIIEDTSLSIFDRVTYRYKLVSKHFLGAPDPIYLAP